MADMDSQREDARADLVTVAEVAERLRLSRMTVYRLIHSGELPALRMGRSFRVPRMAVDEYLEQSFSGHDFDDESRAVNG